VTGDSLFVVSDYSGYTYIAANGTQDAGVDYTGSLVLATDFTQGGGWNQYKRLHGAWLFFINRPGTSDEITLSLRKGDEDSWTNLGTVSLSEDGKTVRQYVRFDSRLKDGHFKLAATNGFGFLGIIFDLDYTGPRL